LPLGHCRRTSPAERRHVSAAFLERRPYRAGVAPPTARSLTRPWPSMSSLVAPRPHRGPPPAVSAALCTCAGNARGMAKSGLC